MREAPDNLVWFLYITLIFSFLVGTILVTTHGPEFLSLTAGKIVSIGQVGVCVAITPVISTIGDQSAYIDEEFYLEVIASAGDQTINYTDDGDLFEIGVDNGTISFTPTSGDVGNTTVIITVTSQVCIGASDSEEVVFQVFSGPPVLDPIGPQNLTEDVAYYYDVNASDEDPGDNDTLVFSDNTDLFEINDSNGTISFTPTNSDVGSYIVRITVTDSTYATDFEDVNFTIENVNDAPVLDEIPHFNDTNAITEDVEFYYDVNATDIDVGDVLVFTDDTALFVIGDSSGVIQWTPSNAQVGNYSVMIYVADGEALDSQLVGFEVLWVNDRPVMDPIGAQTAEINETFFLDVNAADEEDGDETTLNLTFGDDTDLFDIVPGNGTIIFTPTDDEEGIYSVNITVNDSSGQIASELVEFTVVFINSAPTIDSFTPLNLNPSVSEASSLEFSITMSDPDGTTPSVQWYVDGSASGDGSTSYTYSPWYGDSGTHNVTVTITDGELYDSVEWNVNVNDKDPPLSGAGAGGGGGGGFSCNERWNCSDWSPCQYPGINLRTCSDASRCGSERFKPGERQPCEFRVIETCFDGIKNQDEILVDCGGICKPCPTCDDNIKNQGEEKVDCGGPCPGCPRMEKPARVVKKLCGNWKIDNFGELFACFKDSWYVWLIILILLFSLALGKRRKKIIKSTGVEKIRLEKGRVARIKRLIGVAEQALKSRQMSKLKVTCDRIEILYNSLSKEGNKNRVYKKIRNLNRKINKFEA